jgi:hypothetical protein
MQKGGANDAERTKGVQVFADTAVYVGIEWKLLLKYG